jgi:hypothetical protein
MGLRTRHGNATRYGSAPILETLPVDELPAGVPDDARSENPTDRGVGGRFAPGNALARRGGKAKAGESALAQRLGLAGELPDASTFKPYHARAVTFRRVTCAGLAASVGGGYVGPIPSSIVNRAALALAWSTYYYDLAALAAEQDPEGAAKSVDRATRLGEASSRLLREAHEYCAKEATARRDRGGAAAIPSDWTHNGDAS